MLQKKASHDPVFSLTVNFLLSFPYLQFSYTLPVITRK